MESKHRHITSRAPLAAVKQAQALAGAITRNKRIGAAQIAAPPTRRWRRAGRYRAVG